MTASRPKVATNSLNTCAPPARAWREAKKIGSPNMRCAAATPAKAATRRRSRPGRLTRRSRGAHAGQRRLRRQPRLDPGPDLAAYTLKHRQPLLVAARRSRGIVEAPVQPADPPREHRTGLVGVVAHGDDVVPSLAEKALERLRRVAAQIDADLRHRAHGERVDATRLGAGARHLEAVAGQAAEQALRHLAAGGVVRAEKEDARDAHPRRG